MANEPKPPRPPTKKSGSSGEHALDIARAIESPILTEPAPPPAPETLPAPPTMPSSTSNPPSIDTEKAIKAWEAATAVQLELIRVIEKTEQDNRKTRRFVLTAVLAGCLGVTTAAGVMLHNLRKTEDELATTHRAVVETLRAVRVSARALGVKIEADAQLTPQSETKALQAGVDAQKAALEAEQKVAPTPTEKAKATQELKVLDDKAQKYGPPAPLPPE